jgi:prepilin-type N-terminal cleavage/methylation domain-containing protein
MRRRLFTHDFGSKPRDRSGFSLLELVVVLAVSLIVAGLAIPNVMQAYYNAILRSAAGDLAGLMQLARISAAKKNSPCTVRFRTTNGVQEAFIDLNTNGTADTGEPLIPLARTVSAAAGAPSGTGQPTPYVLSGDTSSGTPYDNTNTLGFSSRGLPCNYDTTTSPATCTTPSATYFVYYLTGQRPGGSVGWAAVVVTKSGRTRTLLWNGTSWN